MGVRGFPGYDGMRVCYYMVGGKRKGWEGVVAMECVVEMECVVGMGWSGPLGFAERDCFAGC